MKTSNLVTIETESTKSKQNGFHRMDAIAYGVRARFEESSGYIQKITNTTVNVAKALGVPEKEINKWVDTQLSQMATETEKLKEIKSLLEKHYGSSLGITA